MSDSPVPRVLVLGGGLAGMLAAAAMTPYADEIHIVEPHPLPDTPAPRRGLPQAAHAHILMSGGADAIEHLVPGTTRRLLDAGARRIPLPTGMVGHAPEGWYRRWQRETHHLIACSRDLLDHTVRRQVLAHPAVHLHPGTRATALTGTRQRIRGAGIRHPDGTEEQFTADVTIDATGRGTRTPRWLGDLGITGLKESHVDSGLTYASRTFKAPAADSWPVISLQADSNQRRPGRAATVVPIEGDRWLVSLSGTRGAEPTNDPDAFLAFARTLRHPLVAELLADAEPLTDVAVTRSSSNHRRHYEDLKPWPTGFLAVGDAIASYNPVYGHGMSAAALGALAIRTTFATGTDTRRVQRAIARPVDTAWALAVGQDIKYPATTGKTPGAADRLVQGYASRLSRTATGSFLAAKALTDVMTLQSPPTTLFRPHVLLAALLGPLRPQLTGPQFTPDEQKLLPETVTSHRSTATGR